MRGCRMAVQAFGFRDATGVSAGCGPSPSGDRSHDLGGCAPLESNLLDVDVGAPTDKRSALT